MTNFIFKSQGLIKNVDNKLLMIQAELRHQRSDNVQILFLLNKLLTAKALQKQVDQYFDDQDQITEEGYSQHVTSPQTDSDEQ